MKRSSSMASVGWSNAFSNAEFGIVAIRSYHIVFAILSGCFGTPPSVSKRFSAKFLPNYLQVLWPIHLNLFPDVSSRFFRHVFMDFQQSLHDSFGDSDGFRTTCSKLIRFFIDLRWLFALIQGRWSLCQLTNRLVRIPRGSFAGFFVVMMDCVSIHRVVNKSQGGGLRWIFSARFLAWKSTAIHRANVYSTAVNFTGEFPSRIYDSMGPGTAMNSD